jgi:hypothetical protein
LFAVVLAIAIGIGFAVSGRAQGEPYKSFGVTVRPVSPAPGAKADITAAGYGPGSTATFWISTSPSNSSRLLVLGKSRVNANGIVTDDVTIPRYFQPYSVHVVEVQGVGRNGRPLTQSTSVKLSGRSTKSAA